MWQTGTLYSHWPYLEIGLMRIEAYLCIYGDETSIRAIHTETNVDGASIQQHLGVKAQWSATGEDKPWSWSTAREPINTNIPDVDLRALLGRHKPIFGMIKRYENSKMKIYLQMISRYDEKEHPQGLYLSAETVLLLSEPMPH